MATFFGEVQELLSRAVDESDELPIYNLIVETTEYYSNNLTAKSLVVCVGKIAEAFSKCYLTSDSSKHVLNVFYTIKNNETDSLWYGGNSKPENNKIAATLYYSGPDTAICEVPSYLPETVQFELLEIILKYVQCSEAFVFTSAPVISLKDNLPIYTETPLLLQITTSEFVPPPNFNLPRLQSPNFIAGFAAAVLTEFEIKKKPAVCIINYTESSRLDIPNVQAYEKLTLDSIKKLVNENGKTLLVKYVNKYSLESNLYM